MRKQFSQYQINGLIKLIGFKSTFKTFQETVSFKAGNYNQIALSFKTLIQQFIEIFCGHDLADTDYVIIQTEPYLFDSFKHWIDQTDIETILKSLTYIIWTDRIIEGYMLAKSKDDTIYQLLNRLEYLLRLQWEIELL